MKKPIQNMMRCLALISLGLTIGGCQRLEDTNTPKMAAIPAAMGDLVAVTPGYRPFEQVLWFRTPDQTIVAVRVNLSRGTIEANTIKFPRS